MPGIAASDHASAHRTRLGHWALAASALARHLRDRRFAGSWLAAGLQADAAPKARPLLVFDAYPQVAEETVSMDSVVYRPFNLDPTERFILAALAKLRRPRRIFEFGTYDGATTLLLARSAPGAEIVTFDLPPDALDKSDVIAEQLALAGGIGARFHGRSEATRITQLHGDSRHFDASAFAGTMDLVLVDGGHQYDCVEADSENALRMLAPGGLVIWDDYSQSWPGVVGGVDTVAGRHGLQLVHLLPTDLAVHDTAPGDAAGP